MLLLSSSLSGSLVLCLVAALSLSLALYQETVSAEPFMEDRVSQLSGIVGNGVGHATQLSSKLTMTARELLESDDSSIVFPHRLQLERRGESLDALLPITDDDPYQHYWLYFADKCVDMEDEHAIGAALNQVTGAMHPRAFLNRLKVHNTNINQVHARQPDESVVAHRSRFDAWHQALQRWGFSTPALSQVESDVELTLHDIFTGVTGGHQTADPHGDLKAEQRFPVADFREVFESTHGVDPNALLTPRDIAVCRDYIKEVRSILSAAAVASGDVYSVAEDGVEPHHHATSSYLNAVSVRVRIGDVSTLAALAELPFVERIDVVRSYTRPIEEGWSVNADVDANVDADGGDEKDRVAEGDGKTHRAKREQQAGLDYGHSITQIDMVKANKLHKDHGLTGKGVLIMVADTGFNTDLSSIPHGDRIVGEYDFVHDDGDVDNEPGDYEAEWNHGTATLSIIGASSEGRIYGPAYKSKYFLAKTEDYGDEYIGEETNFLMAIEWAADEGVNVFSASLGYSQWFTYKDMDGTSMLSAAVDHYVLGGMAIVSSAGNFADYGILVPADSYHGITVGGVDSEGKLSPFSSLGPTFDGRIKPDVNAMAQNVVFVAPNGDLNEGAGTSYSCPMVAGVVALLLEQHPTWTPLMVLDALIRTADRNDDPDNSFGWGTVNAEKARKHSPDSDDCPNDCHSADGKGTCTTTETGTTYCVCDPRYYLNDCSMKKEACNTFCDGTCSTSGFLTTCECVNGDWLGMVCRSPGCGRHDSCDSCADDNGDDCGWCPSIGECITLTPDDHINHKECVDGSQAQTEKKKCTPAECLVKVSKPKQVEATHGSDGLELSYTSDPSSECEIIKAREEGTKKWYKLKSCHKDGSPFSMSKNKLKKKLGGSWPGDDFEGMQLEVSVKSVIKSVKEVCGKSLKSSSAKVISTKV